MLLIFHGDGSCFHLLSVAFGNAEIWLAEHPPFLHGRQPRVKNSEIPARSPYVHEIHL